MKGFWYMVESIVAGVILISFLIVLASHETNKTYVEDMSVKGYKIFTDLSQRGSFRNYVYSDNITAIINDIEVPGYHYNVTICNSAGHCNGYEPYDIDSTTWVSSYILAGNSSYEPRIVRLYIWR